MLLKRVKRMSKKSRFQDKGSALLVVLGFLSFMIISAVSFAIYMRVERQASSNYRHAITARHLLESALNRAMDEVDEDLRTTATGKKFPNHWKADGRIFTSETNTPEMEDARVLSLEALSFLPAALVNDTRKYSLDTQWRRLSTPIKSQIDIEANIAQSSGGKNYVGRYAYICVNLSDMVNINNCLISPDRNASNLVSVASLFSPPTDSTVARQMSIQCSNDVHYASLQDFYACMAVANKNFFGGPSDSPYIQFLKDGKNLNFNDAYNHVLVADGYAKTPPANQAACNVLLNQPFAPGSLVVTPDGVGPVMNSTFSAKIREVFPDFPRIAQNGWPFQAMLADYLSKDNVGVMRLDAPSSKLAPMICQVRLANAIMPMITSRIAGAHPNVVTEYNLNLVNDPGAMAGGFGLQVRVCYPFKNVDTRIKSYTLNVEGFVRIDKNNSNPNLTTDIIFNPADDVKFTGTATINPRAIDGVGDAQNLQNKCYQWTPVQVNIPSAPIKMADSDGAKFNNFVGPKINLALVIETMKVVIGSTVYDSAPASPPGPMLPNMPKLYFQTAPADMMAGSPADPWEMPYEWDSLEVPDPRFNHYVVNWVSNGKQPGGGMSDPNYTVEGIHTVTSDLLGKEGRDADIFLSSSGAERLQSVGELGFIVRPYNYDPLKGMKHVNFRTRKTHDPNEDDSEAFFRTIRLYDHGNGDPKKTDRDKIYENFYMASAADGTLPKKADVRINPFSTVAPILGCALDRTPYNYAVASGAVPLPKQNYTEGVLKNTWQTFVDAWARTLTNEVAKSNLNRDFSTTLAEFYGDKDRMAWYSDEKMMRQTIFKNFASMVPIFEADRKMMYAFSLDSLSDRQQLFLYVFQAESIAPISFSEMRSLAGGRAVALVWRDPYPLGSTPVDPNGKVGTWYGGAGGANKGYHEHKVLFFKQLDN